jgi:hypothetical protein
MTAILSISPPFEPEPIPLELPAGCPLPAVCECPEHPSGMVAILYAGRREWSDPVVDDLSEELRHAGIATVVVDLTPGSRRELPYPSPKLLLAERAKRVIAWLESQPSLADLPFGVMGVNGAQAAALEAVAQSCRTEAVVICGGGLDGGEVPRKIHVPVLRLGAKDATRAAVWSAVWFVHYLAMERRWRCAKS